MYHIALLILALALLAATILSWALPSPNNSAHKGYIVHNKVIHSRLLPKTASHTFTYPTLFFLVSLRALEAHALDLGGGWLFGYGGLYWRTTGLRSSAYLAEEQYKSSIVEKLKQVLGRHGLDPADLEDAWMLTMPSYLGFEGVNPLTVYFCYEHGGEPLAVVLEIHNTFGEKHVHVLSVGPTKDRSLPKGFTHQWTFPREFHVSPFNDRSGYYCVSVNMPIAPTSSVTDTPPPVPRVRVLLHTCTGRLEDSVGPVKLAAFLTPSACSPLASGNLLWSLLLQPLALVSSMPRILYQAWLLHYRKGLRVYARPDPFPATDGWAEETRRGGGVGWQPETWVEAFARRRVEVFLQRRARETSISVTLLAGNPAVPRKEFKPETTIKEPRHLTISYLSSVFFTAIFAAPSFAHARLLCQSSRCCHVSSEGLFRELFANTGSGGGQPPRGSATASQRLRMLLLPKHLRYSRLELVVPKQHPIEAVRRGPLSCTATNFVLLIYIISEWIEAWLYRTIGAAFVAGQEPWKFWGRAFGTVGSGEGSSEENDSEYILGSVQR
ncbi:uncharacterized protein PHACADRAFT_211911 [Phanerochaete carnosa HHB-10118-sp]|uniref:DUF1365-domain-containing protein n=1 Tax=Phanerochaete carnosa (strain HHB-10118-sp) TaxID=650164 RepID=K5WQP9_PHACS|nr:uncharacterized protein PHACADRAFT_211911 [Phanerochaete carnosa HHB-10118-sp]EKM52692.1 hypothetical protein PHACADRAFT_211911 [Phanerochaete carnosa HHB-10118-sp]